MKEHYGFTDSEMLALENKGVTIADMFYAVDEFKAKKAEPSLISLYHYADSHGNFLDGETKFDLIAQALFEKLELPDKIRLAEYIEYLEEGEQDE